MMDFILIYGKDRQPLAEETLAMFQDRPAAECLFPCDQARFRLSAGRDRLAFFCFTHQSPHLAATDDQALHFFDGTIFQNDFQYDLRRLRPQAARGHGEIFGVYCYGHFSDQGLDRVYRDLLAAYPLYFGQNEHLSAVANNPHFVAMALHRNSYKREKNLHSVAALTLGANVLDNSTGYKGVFCLPQNAGLMFGQDNAPRFFTLADNFYEALDTDQWTELFEETTEQLVDYARRLVGFKTDWPFSATLSGGYDSRVTLALMTAAGCQHEFVWNIAGGEDNPDAAVATAIAEKMGLEHRRMPDFTGGRFTEPAELYKHSARMLNDSCGYMINVEPILTYEAPVSERLKIIPGGRAGETFNSYYALWFLKKGLDNINMDQPAALAAAREKTLCQKAMLELLRPEQRQYYFDLLERQCGRYEKLYDLDLLFMRDRCPRFQSGQICRLEARGPLELLPGHNPRLHRLDSALAAEPHAAQYLDFKLYDRCCPQLAAIPIADMVWQHPLGYYFRPDAHEIYRLPSGPLVLGGPRAPRGVIKGQLDMVRKFGLEISPVLYDLFDQRALKDYFADFIAGSSELRADRAASFLKLIHIGLFMESQEQPPMAASEAPWPSALDLKESPVCPRLFQPSPEAYEEAAKTVIERKELFFQKDPIFRAANRQSLSNEEKLILELVRDERGGRR